MNHFYSHPHQRREDTDQHDMFLLFLEIAVLVIIFLLLPT